MQQRLDHIHGLRGIAALVVVIQHAAQFVQNAGLPHYRLLLDNINLGRFGVVLFFMISGLVIPFSFRGETPLRNFAISRFFRLYPVYWLSIPVLSYVAIHQGAHVSMALMLSNLSIVQELFGLKNIGPGYWTLKYEVIFYLLCALLFWRRLLSDTVLNGVIVLVLLVVGLVPVVAARGWGAGGFLSNAPYFMAMFFLGMLLRRAMVDGCPTAGRWAIYLTPFAILVGAAMSGWIVPVPENANAYLRPIAMTAGMILPIVVFVLILWRKPAMPRSVMYLGTISYSLYLFQDVGLIFMRDLFPPDEWPIGYVVAVIALSVGIASVVYRLVELPMIAIGHRLTRRPSVSEQITATT